MREEQRNPIAGADALTAAVAIAALYFARDVLIPVALAVLLTFLLAPAVAWLQRLVRSRALAVACVTLSIVAVCCSGAFGIGHQVVSLASQLPTYQDTITRKVRSIRESTRGVVSNAAQSIRKIGTELGDRPSHDIASASVVQMNAPTDDTAVSVGRSATSLPETLPGLPVQNSISAIVGMLRPLAAPFATGLVVFLLLTMMLHSREAIVDRVIRLSGLRQISLTTHALEETAVRVGSYLRSQSLINLIYGTVVYFGLLALGLPNAAVCGVTAGVLRFVPILGIWLGAALPVALAVAMFDGWGHLALVVSLFVVLELVANFVLEPWLYGKSTGLSSIGVVIAIVFWTWIWGGVGLVLAMPMTVCVLVFARQFPRLAAIPILLGEEQALSESARFYQRLLAGNGDDAGTILRASQVSPEHLSSLSGRMLARLDEIVIPALGTARQEHVRGAISEAQAVRVAEGARDVTLDWIGEQPIDAAPATETARPQTDVTCLSVNHESDGCLSTILAACFEHVGITARVPSTDLLLSEILREATDCGSRVILISAVSPSSGIHTRRLCKAVRRALPAAKLVVCAWNDAHSESTSNRSVPGSELVVTNLHDAINAAIDLQSVPGQHAQIPRAVPVLPEV